MMKEVKEEISKGKLTHEEEITQLEIRYRLEEIVKEKH